MLEVTMVPWGGAGAGAGAGGGGGGGGGGAGFGAATVDSSGLPPVAPPPPKSAPKFNWADAWHNSASNNVALTLQAIVVTKM